MKKLLATESKQLFVHVCNRARAYRVCARVQSCTCVQCAHVHVCECVDVNCQVDSDPFAVCAGTACAPGRHATSRACLMGVRVVNMWSVVYVCRLALPGQPISGPSTHGRRNPKSLSSSKYTASPSYVLPCGSIRHHDYSPSTKSWRRG